MVITPANSALVVIDVQGRLAYLMHNRDELFKHIQATIKACRILNIPIIYTEQAPEKIGVTIPEIKNYLQDLNPILKASFSCCGERSFNKKISSLKRKNIIIIGIETHVCVFQTVQDLLKKKYHVRVVADAVSSRTENNKQIALARMQTQGAILSSTEMFVTELMKTSKHPHFKEILSLIR